MYVNVILSVRYTFYRETISLIAPRVHFVSPSGRDRDPSSDTDCISSPLRVAVTVTLAVTLIVS
jgi:hypothetical protein